MRRQFVRGSYQARNVLDTAFIDSGYKEVSTLRCACGPNDLDRIGRQMLSGLGAGYVALTSNAPFWAQPGSNQFNPSAAVAAGYVALTGNATVAPPAPSPATVSAPAPIVNTNTNTVNPTFDIITQTGQGSSASPSTTIAPPPAPSVQWSSIAPDNTPTVTAGNASPTYADETDSGGALIGAQYPTAASDSGMSQQTMIVLGIGIAALFLLTRHKSPVK
jgi:hypothetical protein